MLFYTFSPQVKCIKPLIAPLTLITKVAHPSKVSEYRLISYCTLLYKIISKVLTNRMQCVVEVLMDKNQFAFVPGRIINDNIIISNELVNGYGTKGVSPRCMLKVDMKKAYDSIKWSYLKQIMTYLQFLEKFVEWIYQFISTVSYSILINGYPSNPFIAKKVLQQWDPLSLYLFVLSMDYLTRLLN